jgi:ferredoxin-NADP reductase
LEALERANANFRALFTLTRPEADSWNGRTGRVAGHSGGDLLAEAAELLDQPVFYLCGAPGFIQACFQSLVESGIAEADIRFEVFRGYGVSA